MDLRLLVGFVSIMCVIDALAPMYPQHLVQSLICKDENPQCRFLARRGKCSEEPVFMSWNCRKSCRICYLKFECIPFGMRVRNEEDCPSPDATMIRQIGKKLQYLQQVKQVYAYLEGNRSLSLNSTDPLPKVDKDVSSMDNVSSNFQQISFNSNMFRIIDGTPSSGWSHVQLVNHGSGHICGGVAIGKNLILTCAHCIEMYIRGTANTDYFTMYVGSEKFGGGTPLFMKDMKIHSEFLDMSNGYMERSDYDIALILTTTEIEDKHIIPVSTRAEKIGEEIHFCGFGASAKDPSKTGGYVYPEKMLCSTFSVLDETSEHSETTFLTTGQPAPGDSGGAGLWLENNVWKIGGIFQGPDRTQSNKPERAAFLRYSEFDPWIQNAKSMLLRDEM